jgi:hypothetical protein
MRVEFLEFCPLEGWKAPKQRRFLTQEKKLHVPLVPGGGLR